MIEFGSQKCHHELQTSEKRPTLVGGKPSHASSSALRNPGASARAHCANSGSEVAKIEFLMNLYTTHIQMNFFEYILSSSTLHLTPFLDYKTAKIRDILGIFENISIFNTFLAPKGVKCYPI